MWYVVLKGKVLYLYEDEEMTDCGAVVELGSHEVVVYPEGQTDGEMFAKRNAICLKPKGPSEEKVLPTLTKEMKLQEEDVDAVLDNHHVNGKQREKEKEKLIEEEQQRAAAREKEFDAPAPWFIFVRSNVEMEDWYLALIHASDHPAQTPTLSPLQAVFQAVDMNHLVSTLDEQPDVIPMRWLNALIGRIFFSYYRTRTLEAGIIGRLMKKLSKVKRPAFLADVVVTEVSVGNRPPVLSKPMLKELTKEGDASLEVHLHYKGEIRITIEATATINLGQFKSYNVKLVLAAVLKELEGNLLIKVKRPPSSRIWYAFTQNPRMVLQVEPIVSDRQIKWGMILSTIESKLREIIQESVVMPNMDDIAFFESSAYQHRGGIWSDASRSEQSRHPSPPAAADESQSINSAPSIILSNPSTEGSPPPAKRDSSSPEAESEGSRPASVISVVQEQGIPVAGQDLFNLKERARSEPVLEEERRGRSASVHSIVRPSSNIPPEIHKPAVDAVDELGLEPSPPHSRRSSVYSVKSGKSAEVASEPLTPRKSSDAPRDLTSSTSPSSFLSTLKSKAGDRQALNNTAREAMRKWSVNWNNLKKEFSSEENGDLTSRLRSKMEGSSNRRSSYTDEHQEDERDNQPEEEGHPSRSVSPAGDLKDSNELGPQLSIPSLIQQASKRSIAPVLASKKSLPSVSRVNADIGANDDISEDEVRPAPMPIQAQPQAKTMTIPGIHVSHRGEVMSMGNVAPQTNVFPDAIKSKNPAMQSVYRLWRNPGNIAQDSDSKQAEASATMLETDVQSLHPQPPPQTPGLIRETPPPLPPRSTPRPKDNATRENLVDALKSVGDAALSDESVALLSDEVIVDAPVMSSSTTSTMNAPPPLPPRRIQSTA
ncbi:hypothetical protein P691DRAFT_807920 [Macrolepiota fuliginosa MF-IS2]|uniref:SMP-LTD domain-containing protein n=1 Tax=Macrolepiota fuliginosa MF-IS2 TaxID=1400762 RepID=A0A9P5XIJ0_9AGAR|nr:hypothetical protein P691DRAFT_807920 [Macrolepiota fuliginosa MF-IS2]